MVKRRDVVAGMATLPLVSLGCGSSCPPGRRRGCIGRRCIATADGDIIIHPVDHASLLLGFGDEVIYVDPVGGAARYEGLPAPTGILITHGHGDHFDVPTLEAIAGSAPILTSQEVFDKLPEALKANATAIANGGEGSLNGIAIRAIAAHNITEDRMNYHPVGVGNGYVHHPGRQAGLCGGRHRADRRHAGLDRHRGRLPADEPALYHDARAGAGGGQHLQAGIVYPYHYGDSDLSVLETAVGADTEVRLRNWYPNGA